MKGGAEGGGEGRREGGGGGGGGGGAGGPPCLILQQRGLAPTTLPHITLYHKYQRATADMTSPARQVATNMDMNILELTYLSKQSMAEH